MLHNAPRQPRQRTRRHAINEPDERIQPSDPLVHGDRSRSPPAASGTEHRFSVQIADCRFSQISGKSTVHSPHDAGL
ncbi:hypothetical protein E4U48_004401 [Claviceps purpurea]|nr:hypothetical protein E4U48_004401 [Claviceps purpurea]